MPDVSDIELLRDFSRHGSEEAFAELVRRHINLVFSCALRHVRNAAHAEEITQAVFVILAQKAASLRPNTILEGWLYETTRFTALSFLRGERRRQFREQEAYMQSTHSESTTNSAWEQLAPLLDEAMSHLGKKDRDAVVLRFFKEKSVREIAIALNVNEGAAQKRGLRALEKLRQFFAKRGVALTTTIIAGAVSANSIQAAPIALATSISAVSIAKGAVATGSTLILAKGTLKLMAWAKAKAAIAISAAVVFTAGTGIVVNEIMTHDDGSVKTLLKFDWQKLMDEGHLSGGEIVRMDGSTALRLVGTNELGISMRLLTITNPPITEMNYAVVGEMKYDVELVGHLGMWNLFPPLEPGGQRVPYSSFTGSLVGPSPTIQASSDWREFSMPLDRTGKGDPDIDPAVTAKPPDRLEVSIHCPGLGTVYLRNVKLIQWKPVPQLASR